MKTILCTLAFAGVMFVAATIGVAGPAQAQNYPWCADYAKGGDTNCAFVTYEQCMATLSGLGGFCNRNTQYHPPAGPNGQPQTQSRPHKHRAPSG